MEEKEIRHIIREAFEEILQERKNRKSIRRRKNRNKKADRCTKIAKRKYNRWPSAYASGAVVQCRAGDIWKDLKGESVEYFGNINEVYNEWSRPMYLKEDSMVSEALKYHLDNGISLSECVFRYGSEEYFNIVSEVKNLYENNIVDLNENDEFIVSEYDDDFCVLNGEKIKLNFIFEEIIDEAKTSLEKEFNLLNKKYIKLDKEMDVLTKNKQDTTEIEEELDSIQKRMSEISSEIEKDSINEAEYQGKKVELGKPKRGGSKKFYVYVRNPKTGKIKKVSFGAKSGGGNLAVKLRDPKARKRFADRHNCEQKNDKTTPGYWSCRLPAYSKLLGLSGGGKWW